MPNQKISELTAIVTVDNSVDVLPIVDISANTTKKVTPNALKTALALDNVNNTSDANKPVSIAQQDALNAKVDENAPITAGTAPKITFDAKGLVTSGDSLDETDLPTGINANKIGTGVVSTTEFEYLNGVTSAIQTQIDSKQATLVSGTNIKTINGATVLGAGDITIAGNPPSGVSGAIQFSDGSAFASDAANFFWNNTTKRLGVGTNSPSAVGHFIGGVFDVIKFKSQYSASGSLFTGNTQVGISLNTLGSGTAVTLNSVGVGIKNSGDHTATATLDIRGSGSTSATTSLLVQNSAGGELAKVRDDGSVFYTSGYFNIQTSAVAAPSTGAQLNFNISGNGPGMTITNQNGTTYRIGQYNTGNTLSIGDAGASTPVFNINTSGNIGVGTTAPNASAILDVTSTTKGFLPPRMTTTQKNAITAVAGLVVYDSTTNKLCCYNGSTWNDLF
jgi:hypothetical protein